MKSIDALQKRSARLALVEQTRWHHLRRVLTEAPVEVLPLASMTATISYGHTVLLANL